MITALVLGVGPAWSGLLEDGLAAYGRSDYANAMRILLPLAEKGNANAQYDLGMMYRNGQGVTQDYTEAFKWSRLAAAQGSRDKLSSNRFVKT